MYFRLWHVTQKSVTGFILIDHLPVTCLPEIIWCFFDFDLLKYNFKALKCGEVCPFELTALFVWGLITAPCLFIF